MRKTTARCMGSLFMVGTFLFANGRIEIGIGIIIMLLFFIFAEVLKEEKK